MKISTKEDLKDVEEFFVRSVKMCYASNPLNRFSKVPDITIGEIRSMLLSFIEKPVVKELKKQGWQIRNDSYVK